MRAIIQFFIIGIYIQSSGQNTFNKRTSLGGSRCRWENNIKIGEHSSLLRCSSLLTGEVTEVKDRSTFTFRDKQVQEECMDWQLTLKVKVQRSSGTSITVYRSAPRNIPKDFSLHQHRCEDFRSRIKIVFFFLETQKQDFNVSVAFAYLKLVAGIVNTVTKCRGFINRKLVDQITDFNDSNAFV